MLPSLITEEQSIFVPCRNMTDNVLLTFEILHKMKTSGRRKKIELIMKININKPYDRVRWDFLEAMLINLGFDRAWVDMILQCES